MFALLIGGQGFPTLTQATESRENKSRKCNAFSGCRRGIDGIAKTEFGWRKHVRYRDHDGSMSLLFTYSQFQTTISKIRICAYSHASALAPLRGWLIG